MKLNGATIPEAIVERVNAALRRPIKPVEPVPTPPPPGPRFTSAPAPLPTPSARPALREVATPPASLPSS